MYESVKASFSNRLKELRSEKRVNQAQLAEDLKIGRASVSNYEIGSRLPDADVLVALADYFDVSVDYLIGRTNLRTETINSTDTTKGDKIMNPMTYEVTTADEGMVTTTIKEYSSLIACRTMLDMIFDSNEENGYTYVDSAVVKYAYRQRKLHMDMLVIGASKNTEEHEPIF